MITAELSVFPVGTGDTSLSKYIKKCVQVLKDMSLGSEIKFVPTAMGTQIEARDLESIFLAVTVLNDTLATMGVKRIITNLRIDNRLDKDSTLDSKMESLG